MVARPVALQCARNRAEARISYSSDRAASVETLQQASRSRSPNESPPHVGRNNAAGNAGSGCGDGQAAAKSRWVFPGGSPDVPILGTSLDHQHDAVRTALKLPSGFVIHSLRHSMLTRLGEAGADAFTIMRIAGHSSVVTSQRYVHQTPEGMERAFEQLEGLNVEKFEQAEAEARAEAAGGSRVPAKVPTAKKQATRKATQVVDIKRKGP